MENPRIVAIEWGPLEGKRPRMVGSNARLDAHGSNVRVPLVRLTTEDGTSGFGLAHTDEEKAAGLLGRRFNDVFDAKHGTAIPWQSFDYALWDLAGQRRKQPVYIMAAGLTGVKVTEPLRVPCYDTSLYMDDLHAADNVEGAQLIAREAREGYERGHRAFKIKIGRGARHMPLEQGIQRDIAIVHAVRKEIGPDLPIMLDANNGYNLNIIKHILQETAQDNIFWIEEPFHEDAILYEDLREWFEARQLPTLISDGEGSADPHLLEWARIGLIDVIQYDLFSHGFTSWLATASQLDRWGARVAPHHYGTHYGNYVGAHLAGALQNFLYLEWDEATTPGLDAPGYSLQEGLVHVPHTPGFGLTLDDALFSQARDEAGFALRL
ncbi:enolase C-terminal domain-like protein [Dictyobacter kobayashii]|uniref:Mandelate racemase/muconate lactonizing enzyme C-terminal domain-containing protein n=1 Tax=Dictyobacter kobayashii TaxID=2014872 RepID=A0A402AW68_9CHLR|nr:enolase C-terminal domain-like protein [Dictyobacter kobayashii]GCE23372.1 hypothetical protein KDK_71720 [Dictyobacter kobayashii]